ncbi:hypothetical protein GCM10010228_39790 [Streptomyces massasporeus]|nr:hypothetical protein GCM10010228_39790 [Streptomyces massasporeus]
MPGGGRRNDRGRGSGSVRHTRDANLRPARPASGSRPITVLGLATDIATDIAPDIAPDIATDIRGLPAVTREIRVRNPTKFAFGRAREERRNSSQLFRFACDLSHKGQELLTLCTE